MSVRELPFLPRFESAIRAGEKTATARTKRFGSAGDALVTPAGIPLRLLEVTRVPLAYVRNCCWKEEGCDSPEAFEDVWRKIHPRAGFRPDQMVYLHRFEVVG